MGSCVSSHKIPDSAPSNRSSVPNNDDKLLIPAPVPKPDGADRTLDHQCPSSPFRHAGSKEETFFDSQPWLESDCEDDFLSINGDFTPSGGSTPIHGSLRKTPENEATVVEGKCSAPVPADEQSRPAHPPPLPHENKKLLSELFRESSRNHLYPDNENASGNVVPAKSKAAAVATAAEAPSGSSPVLRELINNRTPSNSGGSSERTTPNHHHHNNGMLKATDDKSGKSTQCCLPQLISSRSFSERRKKTSAAHTQAA